ncbi:6-bladed beta-propeller [Marinisporobacter balticus]|uniref:6-bladed beta-propeller protein n=1 Tax=Marinisporobacter balticus TaxID=2018667 RepID=A0A4R2KKV5_9FIRM|nr:6-bladed beta-propeller [Marinisporobacter balticus]TCO70658.1 6-bladed beta-propeller protein [Marinisporobacter balticus]
MKKISIIATLIIILGTMLSIQGCTNKEVDKIVEKSKNSTLPVFHEADLEKKLENTDRIATKLNNSYKKSTWKYEVKDLNLATGIVARDKDVIVLDGNEDRILVLDYNGQIIKTVGNTGSGPLEFSNPTGIKIKDEKIYIIDGKNDRIQILDEKLSYIKEIKLERKEDNPNFSFQDIEVDKNGTIYVSGGVLDNPGILYYKENETKGHWINEYFDGYLTELDGEIYAINSGIFFVSGKKEWGMMTGESYLMRVTEKGLKKIHELPFGLNSYDFIFDNKEVVSISGCFYNLIRMNSNGKYIDSIGEINLDKSVAAHITKDKTGNYYVTDGKSNNIYIFKKGK